MYQLVLLIHVLVAMAIIGLVLIQHGKGADIGAAFGSGASNTVFGSQGTGSFLFKLTGFLALTFFVTSLSLSAMVSSEYKKAEQQLLPQQTTVPVSKIPVPVDGE
ncbi:preprotein translocase subunit SecG [Legionella impletisoli]|uniref:Protein-export membrane protein SecG n=1 Tax=Legionella impletisoli TaxID=343510 RepID=A0A917JTQ8_9GAMM|nr:preprotein translocase subunit SecG [Legionella impletisoli]GGI84254.1 preprotein translocase subunit SecG [Legionella impletisoli]